MQTSISKGPPTSILGLPNALALAVSAARFRTFWLSKPLISATSCSSYLSLTSARCDGGEIAGTQALAHFPFSFHPILKPLTSLTCLGCREGRELWGNGLGLKNDGVTGEERWQVRLARTAL